MKIGPRTSLSDVAVAVAQTLRQAGVDAVLTGGACATIHSEGEYVSHDLDFVIRNAPTQRAIDSAMASLGFRRQVDHFVSDDTAFFVEFPRGPLSIGDDDVIEPIEVRAGNGSILMLSPTDACRDRLAAYYHWHDRQSLMTAVSIASRREVHLRRIAAWSRRENSEHGYQEFRRLLAIRNRSQPGK